MDASYAAAPHAIAKAFASLKDTFGSCTLRPGNPYTALHAALAAECGVPFIDGKSSLGDSGPVN